MLVMIHSILAYLVLASLLFAVFNAWLGKSSGREFLPKDRKISLIALILTHTQVLIGIIWWVMSGRASSIGESMSSAPARLLALEHPLMMLIGAILITIGWSKHKKQDSDKGKFGKIALFYTLGLLAILSRIPWSNWF